MKFQKILFGFFTAAILAFCCSCVGDTDNPVDLRNGPETRTLSRDENSSIADTRKAAKIAEQTAKPSDNSEPIYSDDIADEWSNADLKSFLAGNGNDAWNYLLILSNYMGFADNLNASEDEYVVTVKFPKLGDPDKEYVYIRQEKKLGFNTVEEIKNGLRRYFTADIAENLIKNCIEPGLDESGFLIRPPYLIERNGRLYHIEAGHGGFYSPDWTAGEIVSQTKSEIVFSYCGDSFGTPLYPIYGKLALEEDEWKFAWFVTETLSAQDMGID
jgi:hypothetical protein